MAKPEDVISQILSGEVTEEEAVTQHPEMKDRLELLSRLASDLRELPQHRPDPAFRSAARLRLLQHIHTHPHKRNPWGWLNEGWSSVPAWASRAGGVMVAGGALTAGVSLASASALPNDTLYPVKRAVEQVQIAAAWTDEAKAHTYLELADRRAAELAAAAPSLDDTRLNGLAEDYGQSLIQVGAVVQRIPSPPPQLLDKVQVHVASQATELEARALNSNAKPATRTAIQKAEGVASNVFDQVVLVAERRGKAGQQNVQLAANPPAAATAAAESAKQSAAARQSSLPAAVEASFDQLLNQIETAPFMAQSVRQDVTARATTARSDARDGKIDAAIEGLQGISSRLQAAVQANQATQYTVAQIDGQVNGLTAALSNLKPAATPDPTATAAPNPTATATTQPTATATTAPTVTSTPPPPSGSPSSSPRPAASSAPASAAPRRPRPPRSAWLTWKRSTTGSTPT